MLRRANGIGCITFTIARSSHCAAASVLINQFVEVTERVSILFFVYVLIKTNPCYANKMQKKWFQLSISILAIGVTILLFYAWWFGFPQYDKDISTVLHNTQAISITEAEFQIALPDRLINESPNSIKIKNALPEINEVRESLFGAVKPFLTHPEVTDAQEPNIFLFYYGYSEQKSRRTHGQILNVSTDSLSDIPLGPWVRYARCGILHIDVGCSGGAGGLVTRDGKIFLSIDEKSTVYDQRVFGIYFYNGSKWMRLTDESVVADDMFVGSDGCTMYYTQDDNFFKMNACQAAGIKEGEPKLREKITLGDLQVPVHFEYSYDMDKPNTINFRVESVPESVCEELRLTIRYGDNSARWVDCDEWAMNHTYQTKGEYIASVLHQGRVLESERVIIPESAVEYAILKADFVDFTPDGSGGTDSNFLVTYVTRPGCDEEKTHDSSYELRIDYGPPHLSKLGSQGGCTGSLPVVLGKYVDEKMVRLKVDGITYATLIIENPTKTENAKGSTSEIEPLIDVYSANGLLEDSVF